MYGLVVMLTIPRSKVHYSIPIVVQIPVSKIVPFTVKINCSSNLKHFANHQLSASNFKRFSQSLEFFFSQQVRTSLETKYHFLYARYSLEALLIFHKMTTPTFQHSISAIIQNFAHQSQHTTTRRPSIYYVSINFWTFSDPPTPYRSE